METQTYTLMTLDTVSTTAAPVAAAAATAVATAAAAADAGDDKDEGDDLFSKMFDGDVSHSYSKFSGTSTRLSLIHI